jgi:nucleoside-diphosphate-sugar epimerase
VRALVVGPNGFLGKRVCAELERHGWAVVRASSADGSGIDPHSGLFRQDFAIDTGIAAVFYLAQSPHVKGAVPRPHHLFAVNVASAVQCAAAARAAGVPRFIFASTGNVYAANFEPHAETSPLRRDDWYALSKVHAEESLSLFRPDLDVTCARLFGLYGPGQSGRLIPNLIQAVRDGRAVTLAPREAEAATTGGLRLSLCHVDDAARILVDLVALRGVAQVNVASGEVQDIRGLAETIARASGSVARLRVEARARTFDLIADTRLLERLLAPRFIPAERGLVETVVASLDATPATTTGTRT